MKDQDFIDSTDRLLTAKKPCSFLLCLPNDKPTQVDTIQLPKVHLGPSWIRRSC